MNKARNWHKNELPILYKILNFPFFMVDNNITSWFEKTMSLQLNVKMKF